MTIIDELNATIQETTSAAQEIAATIRQISLEAENLAQNAKNNVPYVRQVQKQLKDILGQAHMSQEKTVAVQTSLQEVATSIAVMIRNIETAADNNLKDINNINTLLEETAKIDETIDALFSLNILTNLLAIVGRIEGARSGEVGEGFGTVSQDIRQLAEDIGASVVGIRRMVRNIQRSINAVAISLEKSGFVVMNEVEKTKKTNEQLVVIDIDVQSVLVGSKEVQIASQEAENAIDPVSQSIETVALAAAEMSVAVDESSSAAAEQAKAMVELAELVDDIAIHVNYLQR